MKKVFFFFLWLTIAYDVSAQPDYPSAPAAASNMTGLEYFIDVDPGAGNGKQVVLAAAENINAFNFDADLAGLSSGFHRIYIRTRNADGKWSLTTNSFFDNYIVPAYALAPPALKNIVEAEYFFNTDPGFGNGIKINLPLATNISGENLVLSLAGLPPAVHRLYVRVKTDDGIWSLTNMGLFDNSNIIPYPSAPPAAAPIGELEFYIDTDPGFGNATPITLAAGNNISNFSVDIPLGSLAHGNHIIYFRSRQNPWSFSAYAEFFVSSLLPVNWLYVKAAIHNNASVISWATANESGNKHFEVEHSRDGSNFFSIGKVAGNTASGGSSTYSFNHSTPAEGFNYYRIKQIDIDGKFSFSKVISLLNRNAQQKTFIGPNPVQNILYVIEPSPAFLRTVSVFDMQGRLVKQQSFNTQASMFSLQLASLAKGRYVVKLMYRDKEEIFNIIKD